MGKLGLPVPPNDAPTFDASEVTTPTTWVAAKRRRNEKRWIREEQLIAAAAAMGAMLAIGNWAFGYALRSAARQMGADKARTKNVLETFERFGWIEKQDYAGQDLWIRKEKCSLPKVSE